MAPITNAFNSAKDLIYDRLSAYNTSPSLLGAGVKSLKKKFCAGESLAVVENDAACILECQPLHVENGDLVDPEGRRRILKGINVDLALKLPMVPNMPSYAGNSSDAGDIFFDGQHVSFVGRPFPLEQAEVHLERIKSWGYNTIRYLVCWEAIESQGPGIYDEPFIDYTIEVMRIIHKVGGLYVFLDPHQDVWSRYCGGSGAPLWTLHAAGLQPTRFSACEAAILHNNQRFHAKLQSDPEVYPKMLWTSNYKRLALLTMFTLFFAGNAYFPHLKINDVKIQDYLQSHFLGAFEHLWAAVVERLPEMLQDGSMLGFELINEPNCGLVGSPNLATLPSYQHLRIGSTPTVYDCFRLGMGLPVEMDNYKISLTGPQKCGRVVVDPRGERAWLSESELAAIDAEFGWKRSGWVPGQCIFASQGIWKWKDVDLDELAKKPQQSRLAFSNSSCSLLRPNHFNEVSAHVAFDVLHDQLPEKIDHSFFIGTFLVDHVVRLKQMVRKHAPNCFLFIQPPVLEAPPNLKNDPRGIIDDKTIYSPHYYDGMSLMFKSWNYRYNVDTLGIMRGKYLNPVLGVVFGERAIRNCLKKQFMEIAEEGRRNLGNIPVLMSETGMPFDMNNKRAYEDGRYQSQTSALDALANALEGSGMHHTYWCYSSINCHKWGDRWNNEDFSFWSPDDRDLVFDDMDDTNSYSSRTSLRRRSSVSPSLKSIRAIQENGGTHQVLKTKLAHHKNTLMPSLFKTSFLTGVHEEYWDSDESGSGTGLDDSSLISVSSDNLRYKHLKQCYPSPDGVRAVSAVVRPFLFATVGSVVGTELELKNSRLTVTVKFSASELAKAKSTPTVLFVPKWHYPYLNYKDISLNYGTLKYNAQREYLEWYHHEDSDGVDVPNEHTIVIKNHSGNIEDINPSPEAPAESDCRLS